MDMTSISAVVNYTPPVDRVNYVHRAGRTARKGAAGTVVTLVTESERAAFDKMCAEWKVVDTSVQPDDVNMVAYRTAMAGMKKQQLEKSTKKTNRRTSRR
jgi:superfamily II DNA/RNA helicase